MGREGASEALELEKRGWGACTGIAMAAASCRSAGARAGEEEVVASAQEVTRGDARAVLGLGSDAWR
jgi:hypothetical protein